MCTNLPLFVDLFFLGRRFFRKKSVYLRRGRAARDDERRPYTAAAGTKRGTRAATATGEEGRRRAAIHGRRRDEKRDEHRDENRGLPK